MATVVGSWNRDWNLKTKNRESCKVAGCGLRVALFYQPIAQGNECKSRYNTCCHITDKSGGVEVEWLKGNSSKATKLHPEYKSTLRQPSKDNWYKITELLD